MRNPQRKKVWQKIMQSKPFLAFLGVVIVVFAWNVFGFWNKMQETEKNKKIVEDKVAALEQQKEKLSSDINDLNTDGGKEKIFRENFGLAKEGEGLIIITDDKNAAPSAPPASGGFWSFLMNLFK